jgi:benzoyl-CoA reductase/2-hydroxyglutaryl-CoA dehydratase subunit BcrC/BadD/HgdB
MAGDTKETAKEKAGSAKATDIARQVGPIRRAYYQRIREAKENGEFTAWSMVNQPDPIFVAFGVIPVLAENYGPVCAAKLVGNRYCEIAEVEGFSADICSYIRTSLGIAKLQRDLGGEPPPDAPYGGMGNPDMLIGFHSYCDGRYKWMQQLARYLDVPYFGYDLKDWPEGWDINDPDLKRHMVNHAYEQLKRLVAFMEKVTGKKLDKLRLSEALRSTVKSNELFTRMLDLRAAHPCPLPAQDAVALVFPKYVIGGHPECVDFYQRAYDEVKYRADNKIGLVPEEKYRLLWYQLIPWFYLGLYNWLEETFGAVTISTGYGGGEILPSEDVIDYDFPLESMARMMYEGLWAHQTTRRSSAYYLRQAELAKEYDVDGALCMLVPSCRGTTDMYYAWQALKDNTEGIPALAMEADMVDTRSYSDVMIKEKLTAFIDTVDAAKRKRS